MENKKSSKKDQKNNPTTPNPRRRRRSHSRKTLSNCQINFAEARREVARALRRHRSAKTTTTTNSQYGSRRTPSFHEEKGSYPLVKAHLQGVAGPSIVSGPSSIWETLGFHDETSYTWWAGFLDSLDQKNKKKPIFDDPTPGILGPAHHQGPNPILDVKDDEMLLYEVLNIN